MKKLIITATLLIFVGIAFGQTFKKGEIISIHEWTLKLNPDVSMNQFLDFWNQKCIPVMKEAIPEWTPAVMKGVGGDNKFEYAGLYFWDSLEDLRKYWNEDGTPTENGKAAMEKFNPVMAEFPKYGEVTFVAKDWIIIE